MKKHKEKTKLIRPCVQVRKSDIHRYGVFAAKSFTKGAVVEESPILKFTDTDYTPTLNNYVFGIDKCNEYFLALGYGSLYNHADEPNLTFHIDRQKELIIFSATRRIFKGEELFICYADTWFKDRNLAIRKPKKDIYKIRRILNLIVAILLFIGALIAVSILNR